jgi:hypothetical protein
MIPAAVAIIPTLRLKQERALIVPQEIASIPGDLLQFPVSGRWLWHFHSGSMSKPRKRQKQIPRRPTLLYDAHSFAGGSTSVRFT